MITMGCDVGSLFVKAVILDEEEIVASRVIRTTGTVADEINDFVAQVIAEAGLRRSQIAAIGATGNGGDLVGAADFTADEVTCAAAAATFFVPDLELVVHTGGQSIAAIKVDPDGDVLNYVRNDKCAAGTGRFLEMMGRKLGVDIEDVDALVARATAPTAVSDQCVVYAESEVISHINDGAKTEDIFADICDSLARIIVTQGRKFRDAKLFTLTGGVTRVKAVAAPLSAKIPGDYRAFPLDPQLAAALGAALLEEA